LILKTSLQFWNKPNVFLLKYNTLLYDNIYELNLTTSNYYSYHFAVYMSIGKSCKCTMRQIWEFKTKVYKTAFL